MQAKSAALKRIKNESEELAENIDKVADWIYQRQDFDQTVLVRIFKQLLELMLDLSKRGDGSDEVMEYLKKYKDSFTGLKTAFESGDLILTADILHFDFVKGSLKWD